MKTVCFGPNGSVVKWAWNDLIKDEQVEYCEFFSQIKGLNKLFLSRRFSEFATISVKKFVYSKLLKYEFLKLPRETEVLFLFTCQNNMFFTTFFIPFVKFLKEYFPNSKYCFYYYDLIKTCMPEILEDVKREFPLVYTFDKGDAENYGLTFYGEICSKNDMELIDQPSCDFLYIGTDRGVTRTSTILSVFKTLSDLGKKCVFYLSNLIPENIELIKKEYVNTLDFNEEIQMGNFTYKNSTFIINEYVYYQKTLSCIDKCKCMVEIVLSGQTAGTMRLPESVIYKKKLITNCATVLERKCYNPNNILVFGKASDLTSADVEKLLTSDFVEIDYDFSPKALVEQAQDLLFNRNK